MGLWDSIRRRPPSRGKLARLVHRELGRQGVDDVRYDPEAFLLEIGRATGSPARLFLETVYQEIVQDPSRLRHRIRRLARAALTLPDVPRSWDDVQARLLPVIRPVTMALGLPGDRHPLARPALPFLAEMAVIDMPDSIAFVTSERPAEWGVTPDEVFTVARDNLRRRGQPTAPPPVHGPAVLRLLDDGDAYWASHLLIEGWLDGFTDHVGGRPVAFVPDRDSVVIAALDSDRLPDLFEAVEAEYTAAPRGISPMAYTAGPTGRIMPYSVPAGHPLHERTGHARRLLAAATYGDQAAALAADTCGELRVVRRADGSSVTLTEWARGVRSLLPAADVVAFTDEGAEPFLVPWPHVIEHADLTRTPGLDPVRYQVVDWPPGDVLDALRGLALRA